MLQEQHPIVLEAGVGETIQGPAGGPLTFKLRGAQTFFEQFAELPPGPVEPRRFAEIGAGSGMTVLGPPLAVFHPL